MGDEDMLVDYEITFSFLVGVLLDLFFFYKTSVNFSYCSNVW